LIERALNADSKVLVWFCTLHSANLGVTDAVPALPTGAQDSYRDGTIAYV